jgi:hypothetical protein
MNERRLEIEGQLTTQDMILVSTERWNAMRSLVEELAEVASYEWPELRDQARALLERGAT